MMKYHFIPQENETFKFLFEASSFDESVEKLNSYLKTQNDWKAVKHPNGEFGVDLFLKDRYIDTLLVSESPTEQE